MLVYIQPDNANGTKTHVSGKGLPENVKHVKEVLTSYLMTTC